MDFDGIQGIMLLCAYDRTREYYSLLQNKTIKKDIDGCPFLIHRNIDYLDGQIVVIKYGLHLFMVKIPES